MLQYPHMISSKFQTFRKHYRDDLVSRFGEDNVAPFWGEQDAKIVHISQAPSPSAIKNKRPFSDKSGERLRNDWYDISEKIFYDPNEFYITAIGMYFPGKNERGGDLKPSTELADKWLRKELTYLSPELYLLVGALAANFFFPHEKLVNLVMNDQELNGALALVLPHPSPLNVKWFIDNPEFERRRVGEIRRYVHEVLGYND